MTRAELTFEPCPHTEYHHHNFLWSINQMRRNQCGCGAYLSRLDGEAYRAKGVDYEPKTGMLTKESEKKGPTMNQSTESDKS